MNSSSKPACCGPFQSCGSGVARRDFLKAAGLLAATAALPSLRAVAGPFEGADFERLLPADKKLDPAWRKSLFERGQPELWRGPALAHVGMPVGGIGAGQLYLGGDGRLWLWDIFSPAPVPDVGATAGGSHYVKPPAPSFPLEQGFAVNVTVAGATQTRELDARGFSDISFRGEYPVARVQYRDPACPVSVDLEAFSPFIPLDPENSAMPATILHFSVRNTGDRPAEVELAGWVQNAVCLTEKNPALGRRRNQIQRAPKALLLECSAESAQPVLRTSPRPDIVFEDFEKETYEGWTVEGTAFGRGPVAIDQVPEYQGDTGAQGRRLANSHASAPGNSVGEKDAATGLLRSKPFVIERDFIRFLLGGGNYPGKTCVNLVIDKRVVASATGHDENHMRPAFFDVTAVAGQTARLEIIDAVSGPWGNIGVDQIVFTDTPPPNRRLEDHPGYGDMTLALLDPLAEDTATALLPENVTPAQVFGSLRQATNATSPTHPLDRPILGGVVRKLSLAPGASADVTFVLAWFFPDYAPSFEAFGAIPEIKKLRRHYAARFNSSSEVARHVAANFDEMAGTTRLWNRTWYDSTLPYWLLDRTFIPIDTLATQTCHWFDSGRFYAWEGVDCCPGTCQHVWQYAQSMARIFPRIERDLRERVDFGLSWRPDGAMAYRGEYGGGVAQDGFAGTILRVCREHQMSADDQFLRRLWPRIKTSLEYIMAQDPAAEGLLEGKQYNTLDAAWYGPMGWISSLYLAALQAGVVMASDLGDNGFAQKCAARVEAGRKNIVLKLFNGEYFIHKPDPKHPEAINTNDGCHIDQVFGQSYAWQLGLDRVVPRAETVSALESLWKYNFALDVGRYRDNFKAIKAGRWYAMPGEGGLLMCTWPKGGASKAPGNGEPTFVGYFNECMTGFEYQVASHMLWEGASDPSLIEKGLAITRMIHDRYTAARRNPYNEIECGDHYSRAMASYGVFLAACGFDYHGPKGRLAFAPRLSPEDFRAPFTTAAGWGTYAQKREDSTFHAEVRLKWGQISLQSLGLERPADFAPTTAIVTLQGKIVPARVTWNGRAATIEFEARQTIRAGEILRVAITV